MKGGDKMFIKALKKLLIAYKLRAKKQKLWNDIIQIHNMF